MRLGSRKSKNLYNLFWHSDLFKNLLSCVPLIFLVLQETLSQSAFATLETRRGMGRPNFCKDLWGKIGQKLPIADRRVPSNDPRNNCGTHFGSSSLLVSN